jgi:hypothetical protein
MDLNEDSQLRRVETAKALTEAGFPIASATLATQATRGGGPPYKLWGRVPIYTWGPTLAWARARLSAPVRNTSEAASRHAVIARGASSETQPRRPKADTSKKNEADDDAYTSMVEAKAKVAHAACVTVCDDALAGRQRECQARIAHEASP